MKKRVMFDSNTFDKAIEHIDEIKQHLDTIEIYVTNLQKEEICNISDDKKELREADLNCFYELNTIEIPPVFTFDHMDFAHFSFVTEPKYHVILKKTGSNWVDALIGATAISEGCMLITDDTGLTTKMHAAGGQVESFDSFIANLRSL